MNASHETSLHLHGSTADDLPPVSVHVHEDAGPDGVRLVVIDVGMWGSRLHLVGAPVQLLALLHTMVIATEAAIEEAGGMDAVMGREPVSV